MVVVKFWSVVLTSMTSAGSDITAMCVHCVCGWGGLVGRFHQDEVSAAGDREFGNVTEKHVAMVTANVQTTDSRVRAAREVITLTHTHAHILTLSGIHEGYRSSVFSNKCISVEHFYSF